MQFSVNAWVAKNSTRISEGTGVIERGLLEVLLKSKSRFSNLVGLSGKPKTVALVLFKSVLFKSVLSRSLGTIVSQVGVLGKFSCDKFIVLDMFIVGVLGKSIILAQVMSSDFCRDFKLRDFILLTF